jgi:hypothetical protein
VKDVCSRLTAFSQGEAAPWAKRGGAKKAEKIRTKSREETLTGLVVGLTFMGFLSSFVSKFA